MRKDTEGGPPRLAGGVVLTSCHAPLSFRQFVGIVASLMALNALAIDIMLPALPDIGLSYRLVDPNEAQTVVSAFLIGFGVGQIAMGVLADRYGRRSVLIVGLLLYGAVAVMRCC